MSRITQSAYLEFVVQMLWRALEEERDNNVDMWAHRVLYNSGFSSFLKGHVRELDAVNRRLECLLANRDIEGAKSFLVKVVRAMAEDGAFDELDPMEIAAQRERRDPDES